MKIIATLFVTLLASATIFSQNWHYVGPSTGIASTNEADIEVANDGTLYMAMSNPSNSGKLSVLKFDDQAMQWIAVGASVFGSPGAYDIQLQTDGGSYPYVAAKYPSGSNTFIEVFAFDGVNWNDITGGPRQIFSTEEYSFYVTGNDVPMLCYSEDYNGSSNNNKLLVYNLNSSIIVGSQIDVYEEGFDGNVSMTTDNLDMPIVAWGIGSTGQNYMGFAKYDGSNYPVEYTVGEFPKKIRMTRALADDNSSNTAWHEDYLTDDLYVYNYNISTSAFKYLNIYTGNGASQTDYFDYDMTLSDDDAKDLFFILDNTSGVTASTLLSHDTYTNTVNTVSTGLAPSSGIIMCPKIETHNNIYVVSYIADNKAYVKETEIPPSPFQHSGQQFTLCEGDSVTIPGGNASNYFVKVTDNFYDHSTASISYHSSNQTVLPDANISSIINSSPYIGAHITTTGDVTAPTWVYIDVSYLFDGVVFQTETHFDSILVKQKMDLQFNPPSFCSNDPYVNLKNFASPQGMNWHINMFNYSSIFYPSSSPVNNNIHYEYIAPNGCKSKMDAVIVVNQIPDFTISTTPATCSTNDGSAQTAITSGSSPFTYLWTNGSTTNTASNLNPGMYYVTVTDMNGCSRVKAASVSSSAISITGNITGVSCNGLNNGAIDITVTGGTSLLSYYWTHGAYTQDLTNLSAGPYELSVTDVSGCTSTASFIVPEPAPIEIAFSSIPAGCNANNGSIFATINNGIAPLTFSWTDNTGTSIASTQNLFTVGAGAYTLTVTDNNGCSVSQEYMLNNLVGPTLTLDTIIDASCSSNGAINISINTSGTIVSTVWSDNSTNEDLSAPVGTYSVTVTDNNGCIGMLNASISMETPTPVEICMVTVDTNTITNLIVWDKPAVSDIDHFNIYRETSQIGLYQLIDSVLYTALSSYNDLDASPSIRSWRYKLSSVSNCGAESELSAFHKTIHLSISQGLAGAYNLFWDDYEGFVYPNFELYRHTDMNGWESIQSMPTSLYSYTDTPPSTVGLDYMISIVSPNNCIPAKAQDYNSSRSNKANSIFTPPSDSATTTGIHTYTNANHFELYPNPTTGMLNLVWEGGNTMYQIVDLQGKLIQESTLNTGKTSIDLSTALPGIYFLQINGKTNKIIVQ